jgi:hypothetical protein
MWKYNKHTYTNCNHHTASRRVLPYISSEPTIDPSTTQGDLQRL